MYLGKRVIVKHQNKLQEGSVEQIFDEDLHIKLDNNEIITRKYWEVGKIKDEKEN
jgi:hypothetical protein